MSTEDRIYKIDTLYKDIEIVEISEPVKHILSHQRLEAVFVELKSTTENILNDNSLKYYTKQQIEELPKPRLIENYLTSKNI